MWRYLLLVLLIVCGISNVHAGNVSCTGSTKYSAFTFPDAKVVLGSNIPDYTVLYSARKKYTNTNSSSCTVSVNWVMTLDNVTAANKLPIEPSYNEKTHKIYATNIPGLGISVINEEPSSSAGNQLTVPAWPSTQYEYSRNGGGMGNWFGVYLWKIPGDLPTSGTLDFTGPTLQHLFTPTSSADTISGLTSKDSRHVIWSSMNITGSLNLQLGTCDMVGGGKTIQMGTYDGGNGGKSVWKDASFTLSCPSAAGYGGYIKESTTTANSYKNNPIRIQIVPYAPTIDANQGIFDLNADSARGYGIQLAWGDAATLTTTPANPVQLNSWTYAYTLNPTAYRSTAYPINSAAINGDGTIKMAARFIRTSGPVEPGPAKAAVEILASYE